MDSLLKKAIESGKEKKILRIEEENIKRLELQKSAELEKKMQMERAMKWVNEHLFNLIEDAVSKDLTSISTYDEHYAAAAATIDGITVTKRQIRLSDDCGLTEEYIITWKNINMFYIKYTVEGFGQHVVGPYSQSEISYHVQDISGFEGVSGVYVINELEYNSIKNSHKSIPAK